MLHRIESKIKLLEETVALLEMMKPDCLAKFNSDKIYQGALLHYLYLAADTSIAIAEMVLKYKDLRRSNSYFESIDLLGEYAIIPAEFAYDFARIASFRNFLAHHYERIDYREICENSLQKLEDIRRYTAYLRDDLELR